MSELSLILKFYLFKQLISNIDNLCLQKVNTRKWLGIEENMPMVIGSLFQIISDCISLERRKSKIQKGHLPLWFDSRLEL